MRDLSEDHHQPKPQAGEVPGTVGAGSPADQKIVF
jgi:hypothetical protein